MTFLRRLREDRRGAASVEFAIFVPVLIAVLIGILQLGLLFLANAGLYNAVGIGARHTTLYPTPSAADIKAKIDAGKFGLDPAKLSAPTVSSCTDGGLDCVDVSMSYTIQLNFIFYTTDPITLTRTRRAFLI